MLSMLCFLPLFFWKCRCCEGTPDFYYAVTKGGLHYPTGYKLNLKVVWQATKPPAGTGIILDMDVDPTTQTVVCADGALTAYRNGTLVWSNSSFPCNTVCVDGSGHIWSVYQTGAALHLISFDTDGNQLQNITCSPTSQFTGQYTQPTIRASAALAGSAKFLPSGVRPNSTWNITINGIVSTYMSVAGTVADVCAGLASAVNGNTQLSGFLASNEQTFVLVVGPVGNVFTYSGGATPAGALLTGQVATAQQGAFFVLNASQNASPMQIVKLTNAGVLEPYEGNYWEITAAIGLTSKQAVMAMKVNGNGSVSDVVSSYTGNGEILPFQATKTDRSSSAFNFGPIQLDGVGVGFTNLDASTGDYFFTCFSANGVSPTGQEGQFSGVQRYDATFTPPNSQVQPDWTAFFGQNGLSESSFVPQFFSVLSIDTTATSAYGFAKQTNGTLTDVWQFSTVNSTGVQAGWYSSALPTWGGFSGTGKDQNGGAAAWTSPQNAAGAPDGNYATCQIDTNKSQSLDLICAIPTSAGISGYIVVVYCRASVAKDVTLFCELSPSGAPGTFTRPTSAGGAGLTVPAGSEATIVFGGAGDGWGQPTVITSSAIVSLYAQGTANGDQLLIDAVQFIPCGPTLPLNVLVTKVGSINLSPPTISTTTPTPMFGPVMEYGRLSQPS